MRTIWKYELAWKAGVQEVGMPKGSKIVNLDEDHKTNLPCLWVEVPLQRDVDALIGEPREKSALLEPRFFQLFGTGDDTIDERMSFIGTLQHGWFVFHFFERMG